MIQSDEVITNAYRDAVRQHSLGQGFCIQIIIINAQEQKICLAWKHGDIRNRFEPCYEASALLRHVSAALVHISGVFQCGYADRLSNSTHRPCRLDSSNRVYNLRIGDCAAEPQARDCMDLCQ